MGAHRRIGSADRLRHSQSFVRQRHRLVLTLWLSTPAAVGLASRSHALTVMHDEMMVDQFPGSGIAQPSKPAIDGAPGREAIW